MRLPALVVPVLLAAVVALPSVACKRLAERAAEKAVEEAIEKQTGGKVSINGQKGTMTVVTDAGEIMIGPSATIPADFPKDVPLYPGAKPQLAVKQADPKGKITWQLNLETADPTAKITDYYKANSAGLTLETTFDMGTSATRIYQSPKYQVTLMIGAASGGMTSISESVSQK
ncbi:MAG TPA: hypothetical protein VIJ22_14065 [Polyangiaceae bacterium]